MARTTVSNGAQRIAPLTKDMNSVLPASTAAQLVENHSHSITKDQPHSRVAFSQLLIELRECPTAIDADLQSNYKLISVITEAGLDVLTKDDPFSRPTSADVSEIIACLDVIAIAIKCNPEVLFHPGEHSREAGSELCLWLLPKLFGLLNSKDKPIRIQLQQLLSVFLNTLSGSVKLRRRFMSLTELYQICTDDLLYALDQAIDQKLHKQNLELTLLSSAARSVILGDGQQPVALRRSSQVRISEIEHALTIIFALVGATSQSIKAKSMKTLVLSFPDPRSQIWIFKSILRLHDNFTRILSSYDLGQCCQLGSNLLDLVIGASLCCIERKTSSAMLQKSSGVLIQCLVTVLLSPQILCDNEVRKQVIAGLTLVNLFIDISPPILEQAPVKLVPLLCTLSTQTASNVMLPKDLVETFHKTILKHNNTKRIANDTLQPEQMPRFALTHQADRVYQCFEIDTRPAKRAKTGMGVDDASSTTESTRILLEHLRSILRFDQPDTKGLDKVATEMFPQLSGERKVELFDILMRLPCTYSQPTIVSAKVALFTCEICDARCFPRTNNGNSSSEPQHWTWLYEVLTALIDSPIVQSSTELRVMAMLAVRTLTTHTSITDHRDLSISTTGKWCLQALSSGARELRIAAASTLPVFLFIDGNANVTFRRNRVAALDVLRQLSESSDSKLHETSILAYGQVARVCEDEEKNIVLLRLVEYLGHANTLLCGFAQLELRNLAQVTSMTLQELLKPFWRTIGITVVKDLLTRPQKVQQLAEMLSLSVDQFLILTQAESLPYLVLWRKSDLLQRLAVTDEQGDVWNICMQKQNLSGILSLLLVQQPSDVEFAIADTLSQASPLFRNVDAASLLRSDALPVACEVLRMAGDFEGDSRSIALQAFREFTTIVERQNKGSSTQSKLATAFFKKYALGIMASFSDAIENPNETVLAKKRAIRAIEQLLEVAQGDIRIALPQVRACLQSALCNEVLRDHAFVSWNVLLQVLPEREDVEHLVGYTFTAIVQHWASFTQSTQQRAYDTVTALLEKHGSFIRDAVSLLPSLQSIPLMSKFDSQLAKIRNQVEPANRLMSFSDRCRDENTSIVLQALRELSTYLPTVQDWIHISSVSELPNPSIGLLMRSLLDTCIRYNEEQGEILELCGECLGIIGCLDANRIEANREKHEKVIMLSNFGHASEAINFVSLLLETVLVNAFHSVSNPRAQGFLAYVMQELLNFCGYNVNTVLPNLIDASQVDESHNRWAQMSESARNTLTPFLSSSYVLSALPPKHRNKVSYPIFSSTESHGTWLRKFVFDLLQRPKGDNPTQIFGVLSRIVRGDDISIASFLLPFAVTNIIIGGTPSEVQEIVEELLLVLRSSTKGLSTNAVGNIKLCSQNVFEVLDYLSKWLQEKKKVVAAAKNLTSRSANKKSEVEEVTDLAQIACIENVLSSIPADIISKRAVECGSYARALFHWEQYIRQQKEYAEKKSRQDSQSEKRHPNKNRHDTEVQGDQHSFAEPEALYQHLHEIYSQIDEPDGLSGVASCLQVLTPDQQISELRNSGKWAAAQTWYQLRLKDEPDNVDLHVNLLQCLQQAGQHSMVLDCAKNMNESLHANNRILSVTSEAAWCAGRWDDLERLLSRPGLLDVSDFNIGIGLALLAMREEDGDKFSNAVISLRSAISRTLSAAYADSLQTCHSQLLKLHALYELEALGGHGKQLVEDSTLLHARLDKRVEVIGSSLSDKGYLLNIRRAAMQLSRLDFERQDVAALWMCSAKLARKGNLLDIAYDAVLNASQLGDESAKMEQARLLWKEGKHRKAIKSLESAIASNAFQQRSDGIPSVATSMSNAASHREENGRHKDQNILVARAHLLLAKWLDTAGQTQSSLINQKYQHALNSFSRWEKGLYHLGKFYNKLLDTEKALPAAKQSGSYLSGDAAKLVIENYLRSMMFGCKYLFQTLPKVLTLWLDFGIEVKRGIGKDVPDDIRKLAITNRPEILIKINNQMRKCIDRIPAYVFYTALAQMISRVSHPQEEVCDLLVQLIAKVVAAFPQQGLWPLLALVKSTSAERAKKGVILLSKVKEKGKPIRSEGQSVDPRNLVNQGQRISDQLLRACEVDLKGSASVISLTKDLGFSSKVVPCGLVIPVEKTLTASLPTTTEIKQHKAFPTSRDAVSISGFTDDVLVLNSLQRPRKLTVRGSDGHKYGILIKPKDDLRKDQRLMEFNTFVNRSLRKDAESSKRRLYIKTYAVTPLNEECGLIEWVDGLKPLRDIIGSLYKSKNIKVDYNLLKQLLDEACATPDGHRIFSNQILSMYKPVLHEWFTEHFPDPESWFAARLRYTRSCAVTSVLGYALGLGDRHGENVLLEEKDGAAFHVDFNCLFEKGLTFDKPEKIPFRLTHNMVDAFGAYGVEGPFRRSAECAMRVMRSNEDALLTILETFVYDPTADFMGPGPRKKLKGVPETPKEMLESVKNKMRGLMRGESVPLSVEGHVDALIRQATDPANLCAMYIGWCPFL